MTKRRYVPSRIKLRVPKYDYALLAEAAAVRGMTLSAFVIEACRERALAVLQKKPVTD